MARGFISSEPERADLRRLSSCLTGGLGGFTFWHYMSGVTLVDVRKPEFFGDACLMVRRGDFIAVSAVDGGALLFVREVGEGLVVTVPLGITKGE